MKKHLLTFALFLLLPLLALGQDLEAARLTMVKEGVKFYATLSDLNPGHKDFPCASAKTVDEVADCAGSMKGVAQKVRGWGSKPYANASDLTKLRDHILSNVLGSKPDERSKLPAYNNLRTRLTELSKPAETPATTAAETPATDAGQNPATVMQPSGDAPVTDTDMNTPMDSATGLPAEAANPADDNAAQEENAGSNNKGGSNILTWIALLVALGSAAYAYLTTSTLRRQLQENLGTLRTGGDDVELAKQVKAQEKAIQMIQMDIKEINDIARQKNAPAERLSPLPKAGSQAQPQPQPQQPQQQPQQPQAQQPAPAINRAPAPPPQPARPDQPLRDIPGQPAPKAAAMPIAGYGDPAQPVIATFFARFADAGDGFTNSALSPEPDDKRIFEISLQTPHRATYRVSQNPAAQRFALTNTSLYLGPTTRYNSVPQPGSSIVTEKPGIISLHGDKWLIEEPATISFV